MSSSTDNLVVMANRIGEFFAAMPDAEEGSRGIADHLHKFWEPRMRRDLLAQMDRAGGAGLMPIVHQSLLKHRNELA